MSLKMECESKIGMSFKVECYLVTQDGMSLKMQWHSKFNVTQEGMSQKLKIDCHSKWNATQKAKSHKMECH